MNMNALQHLLVVMGLSVSLTGCPLAKNSASVPTGDKGEESDPEWSGSLEELHAFFRRHVFINGREVSFEEQQTVEASAEEIAFEVKSSHQSKLRMLVTDTKGTYQARDLGNLINLLKKLLGKLFGLGHEYVISKVLINVLNIEVREADTDIWQTVSDFGANGKVMDLAALSKGTFFEMGLFNIAPGKYTRMRLNLGTGSQVEVNEGKGFVLKPLQTASKAHERIDFITPFTVSKLGLTTMTIDFDVNDSIRRHSKGYYTIKPNLHVASVNTTNEISKQFKAAEGGILGVFGEIMIEIPPGALDRDVEIKLTPTYRLTPHATEDFLVIGHEYAIEPSDVSLSLPATVSLAYNKLYNPSLGLNDETLDVVVLDPTTRLWHESAEVTAKTDREITAKINTLGTVAVGAQPVNALSGPGCVDYSDEVQVMGTKTGLDLQFFANECNVHNLCYQHGFQTYGKDALACDNDLAAATLDRCEALCKDAALFGKGCSQVTPEEWAAAAANALSAPLYETCKILSANIYDQARGLAAERHPGNDQTTCNDYDGVGISCEPATCTVVADKQAIPHGVPSPLQFTIHVKGSVYSVDFDGTIAYQHEGVATPIDQNILITETGRILTEPKVFTATLSGPGGGGAPMTCSTTVGVIVQPDPCTLVVTPTTAKPGELSSVMLKAGPGYDTAFIDLSTPGVFVAVALQPPDETGSRSFVSFFRPRSSRVYTAKVINGDGVEKTCTATSTVVSTL